MTIALIALFVAAQHPTVSNCAKARDALVTITTYEMMHAEKGDRIHMDEDLVAIRDFAKNICKDGVKRK